MSETSVTACPCCGIDLCPPHIKAFAESMVARGFRIGSATRCVDHNKEVGGVNGSQHMLGLALDMHRPIHNANIVAWLTAITRAEPHFILIYPWGLHIDWRVEG